MVSGLTRSTRLVGSALIAGAAACALLGGCTQPQADAKDGDALAVAENELRLSGTRYLGKLAAGESRTGYYSNPPRYRSFGFEATGGDEVTVEVASHYGDAMAWITDSSYNVLAANDDASMATLDSKVTYKVPTNRGKRSYRIVFRDYDMLDATFTVSLEIEAAAPAECTHEGKTYAQGASFPAADGCNTCSCGPTGVACTKMACVPACNPGNEPNRNYLGTPQSCQTIRFTCQYGFRPFQNDCGCGCERVN